MVAGSSPAARAKLELNVTIHTILAGIVPRTGTESDLANLERVAGIFCPRVRGLLAHCGLSVCHGLGVRCERSGFHLARCDWVGLRITIIGNPRANCDYE